MTSIFTDFGFNFLKNDIQTNEDIPFKNHPQIPFIIDSLCRRERHHIAFISQQSDKIHQALLKALAEHISTAPMPKTLKNCRFIYFDAIKFSNSFVSKEKIADDFQALISELKNQQQRIIFAINQIDFLTHDDSHLSITYLNHLLKQIATHDEWRLLTFISEKNSLNKLNIHPLFSVTHLIEPRQDELIALLKIYRTPLQNFHQTIISDEVIVHAYTLATHYLPGHSHFDKTLELLDSAAARASLLNQDDNPQKTLVTSHFLAEVISHRTQIPITHLHNTQFQVGKFVETLRKNVFGHDAAINSMASLLQNACIKLQDNSGPLCNFLLVGPHDVGKTEMVYAMAAHLFGSENAVLHVNLNRAGYNSLADIKIFPRSNENSETNLLSAISEMPYAIVLIEDIDQVQQDTFGLMKGIFDRGFLLQQNNKYDFRHAIIIATTRVTSEQMNNALVAIHPEENTKAVDLMQLVLNEHVQDSLQQNTSYLSPQELCDELMPKLIEHFPETLLQKFNIIPFVPLDYAAFEKIIRAKIKMLARRLHNSFGIELSFAPEVIKFLAHEALWRKTNIKSLDKLLDQHLYSTVTHEILLHAEDKDRSKRLLIQLNESGQLLRAEFLTSNEAAFYSL
jgi:ATP-dependent Clp protease ATP-binding subunit ClpA